MYYVYAHWLLNEGSSSKGGFHGTHRTSSGSATDWAGTPTKFQQLRIRACLISACAYYTCTPLHHVHTKQDTDSKENWKLSGKVQETDGTANLIHPIQTHLQHCKCYIMRHANSSTYTIEEFILR